MIYVIELHDSSKPMTAIINKIKLEDKFTPFYGDVARKTKCMDLIMDGHETLPINGINQFHQRLDEFLAKQEDVHDVFTDAMDEKRNFISYALTIVTTLLAPLAVLTGYL